MSQHTLYNQPAIMPANAAVKHKRLDVVDSLRGFALLAIVLLHNLEHYNLIHTPEGMPSWLTSVDAGVWNATFFLLAGKAYATFSLLFGFSFYIQLRNERNRGGDFRWRFAWRMFLLFLFSQLHALFYNGDILLLYSVVGLLLIPVCNLKDKTVFIIAVVCLLQPIEWIRLAYSFVNPDFVTYGNYFMKYAIQALPAMSGHSVIELLKSNITVGQLYSNIWQVENGRLFQTMALFMFGMLLGRREYFVKNDHSVRKWKKILLYCAIAFVPLHLMRVYLPGMFEHEASRLPINIIFPSLANFAFMGILVSFFTLMWFKVSGYKFQKMIIPYGRMTLTNYIVQSVIGVSIYYGFGLGLYQYAGATLCLLIGIAIFAIQLLFSRWWLSTRRHGPLEYIWFRLTWIGRKDR